MEEEINFCPTCGEYKRGNNVNLQKSNPTFLMVLCVLTIIGSVFTIGRAYLYEMSSLLGAHSNYIRGWIYVGSSVGTLAGAIMMIKRKLDGLYIYSASQVINIITVLVASFSYSAAFRNSVGCNEDLLLASGIALFFAAPSIVFLVLYWTDMIKQHLK
jgi:hypothetical protein